MQNHHAIDRFDRIGRKSGYKTFVCAAPMMLLLALFASPAKADCWQEAGRLYGIQPALLYAIAQQESGLNPAAINHNRNGSRDIGIMQVNSYHLPRLARQRITEKSMLSDSCQSIKVGAGILSDFIRRYGHSWEAVGAYNAGTATDAKAQKRRRAYAGQVAVRYQRLFQATESGAVQATAKVAVPGSAPTQVQRAVAHPPPAAPLRQMSSRLF